MEETRKQFINDKRKNNYTYILVYEKKFVKYFSKKHLVINNMIDYKYFK